MGTEMQHGMVVAGHLGGYVPGGDVATWYPDLWEWLYQREGVRSVLDVGCGDGVALSWWHEHHPDVNALGVDGVEQPERDDVIVHDYTLGPWVPAIADEKPDEFDLVWSCEFVEHVEERYIGNFLATFDCAPLVLMTHAEPGQGGWHHVNCQHAGYWIDRMAEIGFDLDGKLTNRCRELARRNHHPMNHYARSGLAFRRREEEPVAEHERLVQGESEMREEVEEAQEIAAGDVAPMPDLEGSDTAGGSQQEGEDDGRTDA